MSKLINLEVQFFLISVVWGVILLVIYDCLRIFRKVVEHGEILTSIEDIIYWMVSSVLIFRMMFEQNDGIIRGFSIMGVLLGMVTYKYSISEYVVKGISFILIKIKHLIQKVLRFLMKPMKFFSKKLKQFLRFIGKKVQKILGLLTHFVQKLNRKYIKALKMKNKRGRIVKSGQKNIS